MALRLFIGRACLENCLPQSVVANFVQRTTNGSLLCAGEMFKSNFTFKYLQSVFYISTNNIHAHSNMRQKSNLDLKNGPGIEHFMNSNLKLVDGIPVPYLNDEYFSGENRTVFFDVYGCQMNVNDTEVVWSILKEKGYQRINILEEADIVLVVTCSIREGAENKVWNKLNYLKSLKVNRRRFKEKWPMKIGVLGCMAERLKERLLEKEKSVDLVAGPDSYKDLPRLLALTESDQKAVNVQLSFEETYADITPVRLNQDSISAFVSIMRGCDNMCTYCIVPFTRGRERSRPLASILNEVRHLSEEGVKEITLLGQNVNSYRDISEGSINSEAESTHMAEGFRTVYKPKKGGKRFAELLKKVSEINPEMRVRFTSPHPKDFPDEVLNVIKERPNVCKSLHLPAQSGNSKVLERMGRGYTREAYLNLIDHVREIIPEVTLSSDFICGFCGETDEEFEDTLDLMTMVEYNYAFIFAYSMREKTRAFHRLKDEVPHETKIKRVNKLQVKFRTIAEKLNRMKVGQVQLILVEGESKRSKADLVGRNDGNTKVIFPAEEIPETPNSRHLRSVGKGDYVAVKVHDASSQILKGKALYHTTLQEFTL